jgi:hypothetical protein
LPFELMLASSVFKESCRDAGKLAISPPAQMPGSLTNSAFYLVAECSSPAEAAENAKKHIISVDGVEGECLAGLNRRTSLAQGPCGGLAEGMQAVFLHPQMVFLNAPLT